MIDGEIALAFESVLGISSIFWLNREKKLSRLLKGLICIEALFRKESPGFKENWGIFAVGRDSVKAG